MKTQNSYKQEYITPTIEVIQMDNEISLAMESTPPVYEISKSMNAPEYFKNDPFKINIT
jgi:hypothetical protein